jgi:hypothetical protein
MKFNLNKIIFGEKIFWSKYKKLIYVIMLIIENYQIFLILLLYIKT